MQEESKPSSSSMLEVLDTVQGKAGSLEEVDTAAKERARKYDRGDFDELIGRALCDADVDGDPRAKQLHRELLGTHIVEDLGCLFRRSCKRGDANALALQLAIWPAIKKAEEEKRDA